MDPFSAPLLRRIRWGNVARLTAVPAAVLAVVGWSRLDPSPPDIPAAAPRPVAVPAGERDARERLPAERAAPAGGRRRAAKRRARRARRAARQRTRAERAAAAGSAPAERAAAPGSAPAERGGVVERGPAVVERGPAVVERGVRGEVAAGSGPPPPLAPPPDPVADEFGVP